MGKLKKNLDVCVAGIALVALAVYEIFFAGKVAAEPLGGILDGIITRALGAIVAAVAVEKAGYKVFNKCGLKAIIAVLPCFLAVCANPPLLGLLFGDAAFLYSGAELAAYIALFFVECLLVGAFEELLFRGILLPAVIERRAKKDKSAFWSVIISSAAFALVHLFNLFTSSPTAVIMQVGYSFLLGGASCFVFLKTGNILPCVLLHALFNFCGGLVQTLGEGGWGGVPSAIIAVAVCVPVAVYVVAALLKTPVTARADEE